MKRAFLGLGISLFLLSSSLSAQGWMRTWGGPSGDEAEWVEVTSDSGFVITGASLTPYDVAQVPFGYLTKTNSSGGILWMRAYPGSGMVPDTRFNCVCETSVGCFVAVGLMVDLEEDNSDQIWILKTDQYGNVLWSRTYGGKNADEGIFVRETPDGGYVLTAEWQSKVDGKRQKDLWVLRTDSLGDTLWTRMFGGDTVNDAVGNVNLCSDGSYVVAGGNATLLKPWVLKLDDQGKTIWQRTYNLEGEGLASYAEETSDGGFIVTGSTGIPMQNRSYLFILKLDSNGDSLWVKLYGTVGNRGNCVHETPDGGYIVAGFQNRQGLFDPTAQGWLLKLDSSGDTVWTRTITYDSDGDNEFSCVQLTPDGGYILAGQAGDYEAEKGYEYWLVKTDSEGYIGIIEEPVASNPTTVEPRSAVGRGVKLSYSDMPQGFHALVFDSTGRKVDELHSSLTSGTVEWGAGHSPGVYFIKPLGNSQKAFKVVLVR